MNSLQEDINAVLIPAPNNSKAAIYAFLFGLVEKILAGDLDQHAARGSFNRFLNEIFHPKTQLPATWQVFKNYLTGMQYDPNQLSHILTELNQTLLSHIRRRHRPEICDQETGRLLSAFKHYRLLAKDSDVHLSEILKSSEYLQHDFFLFIFATLRNESDAESQLTSWYRIEGYDSYCQASQNQATIAGTFELAILARFWHTSVHVNRNRTVAVIHKENNSLAPITLVAKNFADWSYKHPKKKSYWAAVEPASMWNGFQSSPRVSTKRKSNEQHIKKKQAKSLFTHLLKINAKWLCANIQRLLKNNRPADIAAFGDIAILLDEISTSGEIPIQNSCRLVNPNKLFNVSHADANPVIAERIHSFSQRYFSVIVEIAEADAIKIITNTLALTRELCKNQHVNNELPQAYVKINTLCADLLSSPGDHECLSAAASERFREKIQCLLPVVCQDEREASTQVLNNCLTINRYLVAREPQAYAKAIVRLLQELRGMGISSVSKIIKRSAKPYLTWFQHISEYGITHEMPDNSEKLLEDYQKAKQAVENHPQLYELLTNFHDVFYDGLREALAYDLTPPLPEYN